MILLTFYLLLAICVSFLCSLLESVILSVTPAYIAVKSKEPGKTGLRLANLKSQIDRPLAAILTLNTIAHTLGAAGVGAQVAALYGNSYVAIASGLLTFIILVFSEIIPKTLGAVYWKKLAPFAALTISILIKISYPFVILSEKISSLLGGSNLQKVTREEMIMTAEIGADEGTLKRKESLIIRNLLMLDKIEVTDIMTPRSVVFGLEKNVTVGEVFKGQKTIRFSRIPVFNETMDNIEGFLLRYKLMEAYSQDLDSLTLDKFMKPVHTVPENASVSSCLDQFIKRKEHMFIVIDEYGVTSGIITLEDAVETLLGVEIVDEFDSVEDMRKYARELWEERKRKKSQFSPKSAKPVQTS